MVDEVVEVVEETDVLLLQLVRFEFAVSLELMEVVDVFDRERSILDSGRFWVPMAATLISGGR